MSLIRQLCITNTNLTQKTYATLYLQAENSQIFPQHDSAKSTKAKLIFIHEDETMYKTM